jgi:hypothetical protein
MASAVCKKILDPIQVAFGLNLIIEKGFDFKLKLCTVATTVPLGCHSRPPKKKYRPEISKREGFKSNGENSQYRKLRNIRRF